MHPAYSVIFFTTASGAGFGLLALLSLTARRWAPDMPASFALVSFGVAFALITAGLLASTSHLGQPTRAWRAFSQWRTSWLSREGIAALATLVPGSILALRVLLGGDPGKWSVLLGLITAALALATLWSTGMIYASLPTIRAWKHPLVAPLYCLFGLATGALLFALLLALWNGSVPVRLTWFTLAAVLVSWLAKVFYWEGIDASPRTHTIGAATGLGGNNGTGKATVRPLDPPHTQANFVMREMGYEVGRRHAQRLRQLVGLALFLVPAVCLALTLMTGASWLTALLMLIATVSAAVGIGLERWLFFAEAEHVAMLFYGRQSA
jgi:sulfite dehydrogenase (quinone) subunit SoeC